MPDEPGMTASTRASVVDVLSLGRYVVQVSSARRRRLRDKPAQRGALETYIGVKNPSSF
jgi:hypothetical protein